MNNAELYEIGKCLAQPYATVEKPILHLSVVQGQLLEHLDEGLDRAAAQFADLQQRDKTHRAHRFPSLVFEDE